MLEMVVSMGIISLFMAGVFEVSARVLAMLRAQKEAVAVSQGFQERTEKFRSLLYSQITDANYLQTSVLNTPTDSAVLLPTLVETVTISLYPPDGSASTQLTAQGKNVTINSNNATLGGSATVRVDLRLSWKTAQSRTRVREISTIIAKGGSAP